jgi:hypothetical protein
MVSSKSCWIISETIWDASFWIADHPRHWTRAIAFVRQVEFRARHDRKSWDHLETEGGGVIVVDEENHIGLMRLLPFLGEGKSAQIDVIPYTTG